MPKTELGKKGPFLYALTQVAPCVLVAEVEDFKGGELNLEIKNNSNSEVEILWIEIILE